jgi:hypothetical protein
MIVDHVENVDPVITAHLNIHLNVYPNFTELEEHPLVVSDHEELLTDSEGSLEYVGHPMTWTTVVLGVLLIAALCYVAYKCWFWRGRRWRPPPDEGFVKVRIKKPVPHRRQAQEMDNLAENAIAEVEVEAEAEDSN